MLNRAMTWAVKGRSVELERAGLIMGILNVTPDSFSDGGRFHSLDTGIAHAREMIAEGADIIDIGGESTRPGANPVGEDEELNRTIPVVEAIRAEWEGLISIDTSKARVAETALKAGANIVNDVTGLRDPAMVAVCREEQAGVVVMHMLGEPRTMQQAPHYEDVVAQVRGFFDERFTALTASGLAGEALCFDPGIGFGKTLAHNCELLGRLCELEVHGRPLLMGLSRKSFIGKLLDDEDPTKREWPTVALTAATRERGARIHRVHSVRPNREALRMVEAILGNSHAG